MKNVLLGICVFCASACFAQVGSVLSNEVQAFSVAEHDAHATQHDLAPTQDLFLHSGVSYAQGERPLWEFGPISQPKPLGDVARDYRKKHADVKKAEIVWEN